MDEQHYKRCRAILVAFLAADISVRLAMVKLSLDDFLLFARHTAPGDSDFRAMLAEVVRGLQDHYARGVTDAALFYLSEHPTGLDAADLRPRRAGEDVYDHGRLEDVEVMARAAGYPVHELKDLFVELGVPGKPGYPRDIADSRAGHPPSAAPEYVARAHDPTAIGSQPRGEGDTAITNFCSVVIGESPAHRQPSPTISEQERDYTEVRGGGLPLRRVPHARTPGCPDCVRAGTRCILTAKCCARCDGVSIRQALPATHTQLAGNINEAAKSILNSTQSANANFTRLEELGPALQRAEASVQSLTGVLPGPADGR